MAAAEIDVEVVYAALPPAILRLRVPAAATVLDAISAARLTPAEGLDLRHLGVGIFGRRVGLGDAVRAGDRIEIYLPLRADPKARRKARAQEARLSGGASGKRSGGSA